MENISELNIFVDPITILCYAICIRFVAPYSRPSFWKRGQQAGCTPTDQERSAITSTFLKR